MNQRMWPAEKPTLREAGQGLDDQSKRIFVEFAGWFWAFCLAIALATGLMIAPYVQEYRLWLAGACLVFAVFVLAVPMIAADRRMGRVIAGRHGERIVGQALKTLERKGARVVHDVCGPIGNVDHVLIHPSGIYAIETKHWSRPVGRWVKMTFDGQTLRMNDRPVEYDPVPQALRQAAWLREHLTRELGLTLRHPVRAAVIFPGWQVDSTTTSATLQVSSLKGFLSTLDACPDRQLSEKQVAFFYSQLVRSQQAVQSA